ncbi:beta-ACP synthase [Sphaerisporangium siamense]|uniref:Act minimal PKS ketosynthase (KS/KS alpha) n=1 Tax=Sphaerisporangium siamense TaxID=795645 RepID=A0A7W7DEN9_9ACTN|nr:beta-ketoacyl-[acyl-carrier-protein] synthase family protein [Sphaerisporangium siamense]MBB4703968.1 act minimal PKS ketosynthase (KS/KS alpha) [Sphaerisporangium siamense]GII82440.1 beta-ACP synthase [Sphaerisporangium siamense]
MNQAGATTARRRTRARPATRRPRRPGGDRRVVITGIGVTAPGGIGTRAFWDLLTSGRTATRAITLFDATGFRSRIAAECDFDPAAHGLSPQEIRRMDRAAQLGVVSAREALADSGLTCQDVPPERLGAAVGSAVGCTMGLEEEYVVLSDGGRQWLVDPAYGVPQLYGYMVPSTIATEVAWAGAAEGPVALISTGCTAGLDSVGHGYQLVREGSADAVLAGAADAPISPITVACFDAIKATTPDNDRPATASRPFDRDRNGFVLGEGAAMFVLEERAAALRRGARVYAEIVGFAGRSNAFHMTGLKPDGREMAEAIRTAMRQARLRPDQIDYINAHGSGTRQNDRHETAAFKDALGERAYQVPVSSIKSMIGHSLGAIGSIEVAACALAITHDVVPPTANLRTADPECDLDYVPLTAREHKVEVVLSVGSGFGGFQTAMLLARHRDGLAGTRGGPDD